MKGEYGKKDTLPLWGVSTSHLLDKHDFAPLLEYNPDVIEFYNYKSIDPIVAFCSQHNIRPALHVPTPFEKGNFTRFFPTAPGTNEDIESAIEMTRTTLKCASEIDALYVVVHFPTPCPPYSPVTRQEIDRFFGNVCHYADQLNVDLLVENMTPHTYFHTPKEYMSLTNHYNLHFCLDVGHAHLLQPHLGVQDFIEGLGKKTKSVHFYNLTKERYPLYGHEPVSEDQNKEDGWMDLQETLDNIICISNPTSIILEYNAMNAEEIKKSAEKWNIFKKRVLS